MTGYGFLIGVTSTLMGVSGGSISNNTVSGNAYIGANNASSAGILVFGGFGDPLSTPDVHNNTLVNNKTSIYLAKVKLAAK